MSLLGYSSDPAWGRGRDYHYIYRHLDRCLWARLTPFGCGRGDSPTVCAIPSLGLYCMDRCLCLQCGTWCTSGAWTCSGVCHFNASLKGKVITDTHWMNGRFGDVRTSTSEGTRDPDTCVVLWGVCCVYLETEGSSRCPITLVFRT